LAFYNLPCKSYIRLDSYLALSNYSAAYYDGLFLFAEPAVGLV